MYPKDDGGKLLQSGDALETETLPPLSTRDGSAPPSLVPSLTILCHPDPSRVGEQARLPALLHPTAVSLSRAEPIFRHPEGSAASPLADPYISRRPIKLTRLESGAIRLEVARESTSVAVDGQSVEVERIIAEEALEEGVVIELSRRVSLLLHLLGPPGELPPELGLIGISPAMLRVKEEILRVAPTEVTVLLSGDSGTGKELVARAIHRRSLRSERPYQAINMAAIPATTAAAELFGHARGAFTGATSAAEGYFDRVDRGTLFLDEVGDTPPDVQAMLLRVLETGEIQPVGAQQTRRVDVRLIAATESDLGRAVAEGSLRLSFLQRLSGFQLELPPLRKRRDDIGRLLLHFLRLELAQLGEEGRLEQPVSREVKPWLSSSVVSRLVRQSWPGNVRQLHNVARQLVLSCRAEPTLRIDATVERLLQVAEPDEGRGDAQGQREGEPLKDSTPQQQTARLSEIGEEELHRALASCDWQPAAAARLLGIGRTSMYKLLAESPSIRMATDIPKEELITELDRQGGDVEATASELEVSVRSLKLRLNKLGLDTDE